MSAHIHYFRCLSDNVGVLIHDPETRRTACVDAPEAEPILEALAQRGWDLSDILVTHHHADHTQGIPGLKARFARARIVGPAKEAGKIGTLDQAVSENDWVQVGSLKARVLEVPGHTAGHVAFHFEDEDVLFAGDTLFGLGCGRPFEAPAPVLFHSLMKLARLRGETEVYCGHDYTLSNARFAVSVDGANPLVTERAAAIEQMAAAGTFAGPTTIALERATNPFLRADEEALKRAVGMADADAVDVFAALRERKNRG